MTWPTIACSLALTAANVAIAECAAPPVTTPEQAVCLAGEYLKLPEGELKTLRADASRHGGSWRVSLYDPTPNHVGGPGGEVVIDAESGKMLSGGRYQ